jgi:hypothetical protein
MTIWCTGVGENVRGTVLGAIDDWEERGEQKHHNVARQGRAEIDQAFQQLWGTSGSGTATAQAPPRPSTSCIHPLKRSFRR